MRIAANETERLLAAAAAEAQFVAPSQRAERTEEVTEALRTAAELRRQSFGRAIVRGRKDGVPREVITTGIANASGYRLCLMPYTEAQETHRRRTTYQYFFRRGPGRWLDSPPPRSSARERDETPIEVRALVPKHHHELYIKESRLERPS